MQSKLSKDKLIVVTGAAGFIGSCTAKYLNEKGFSNLLLVDDIKKTEKWKNLLNKKCVDFVSRNDLFKWLEGKERDIQAFIHLGACSDTMEADGNYLMENNFRYTVRLAEYAMKYGHRFIYASSAATYGNGSLGFVDDHEGLEELRPLNLYGFSKYYFDLWAKQQGVLEKLVGLKYFNVFGPNENHKGRMASMVYKMVPVVQKEGMIRLFKSSDPVNFGDGDQCRDFIYVKDAVRMTCNFLENEIGGIFNIGTGETTTWNALAKAVFKALDKPAKIEYIDMPGDLVGQYQNYTRAEMGKYMQKTGVLKPCMFTVEDAVADYVRNYLLKDERW
ncbi:MAG: ADP-glyceromanno-heptose 6-epimerase [Verrucomicrobia bacterium]|nr:ADP-glyceromanno-heptose 6-epimerase [Verrucomicrobiota bacterium]